MRKRIAVLGGSGFIGGRAVEWLSRSGHAVRSISRLDTNGEDLVAFYNEVAADSDYIVHAASCTRPATSATKPLIELDLNLRATIALTAALQNTPTCGIIFLSSGGTVYDQSSDHPATEDQTLGPANYYGSGKVAAEMFLHALSRQYGRRVTIIRPTNVYGPGQAPSPGFGIIPTAFACCLRDEPFTLYGDGSNVRDYLYVDDLCRLILDIVNQPESPPDFRIINAASGKGYTINQVLDAVESVSQLKLRRVHRERRILDANTALVDATLAQIVYCWNAEVSLPDGLATTWSWIRERGVPLVNR